MIQEIFINKAFPVFLNKNDNVISKLFQMVQGMKNRVNNINCKLFR